MHLTEGFLSLKLGSGKSAGLHSQLQTPSWDAWTAIPASLCPAIHFPLTIDWLLLLTLPSVCSPDGFSQMVAYALSLQDLLPWFPIAYWLNLSIY